MTYVIMDKLNLSISIGLLHAAALYAFHKNPESLQVEQPRKNEINLYCMR